MERRQIVTFILSAFPAWGCLIYAPFLKWLAGPTYTTAPNQNAMVVLFLGYMAWLIVTALVALITTLFAPKPKWPVFIFGLFFWGIGYFFCYELLV